MNNWTPDDAAEWEKAWKEPIMQRGLLHLKERCRVSGTPQELSPGYDGLVLAAQAYAHAQGQSSVFAEIESMNTQRVAKDLPPPFQKTPPPKPAAK